jgi:hypothetical protein
VISRYDLLSLAFMIRRSTLHLTVRSYLYSRQIMHHIQSLEPPGRFLSKNYSRCEWEVVTDAVAREKVCQVSWLTNYYFEHFTICSSHDNSSSTGFSRRRGDRERQGRKNCI